MKTAPKNKDELSRHGGRGKSTMTGGRPPQNRQKTGSNMLDIQGPKRAWGNPPPSDSGLGPTESATRTSGSWDKTPSSFSGWGEPAPTAAGWGEPADSESLTSGWRQETNFLTETECPLPHPTEPVKHHCDTPPSLQNLTPGVLKSRSTQDPTSSSTLRDSERVDSRATRKAYLDNLAKLTNASQFIREYSEAAHKLEKCRTIAIGFSQLDMDRYVPEDENTAQELKLRVEATISKLVDAQLWPVGPPEISQHKACEITSQQIQDIQGRLKVLEDTFKFSMDQGPSLAADGNPLTERHLHVIPEVNGDASPPSGLEQLEIRVADVCNEVIHLCDGAVQDFEAQIEQKLMALRIQRSPLEEGELCDHLDLIPGPVLGNVSGEINKLVDTLSGIEGQTSDIMHLENTLVVEISKISADNDIIRSKNNQLDSVHEALKSDIAQIDDNVQSLLSEIKSSKMISCPLSVVHQQMRKDIVEDIIHDLRPALLSLRQQFDSAMASGREESLEYFMGKLTLALKTIELMYKNLGRFGLKTS